jgi:hypothetical protein
MIGDFFRIHLPVEVVMTCDCACHRRHWVGALMNGGCVAQTHRHGLSKYGGCVFRQTRKRLLDALTGADFGSSHTLHQGPGLAIELEKEQHSLQYSL